MSVIAKALGLLNYFSPDRAEIGLSQFRLLSGRDKATIYRHLSALENAGLIEKNPTTKAYRIGPAVLHLAAMREATVPRVASANRSLTALAALTGETAHVSVLSGTALHSLCACQSDRHSTRAVIDIPILPLHATASGICALSFGPADLIDIAKQNMTQFTDYTTTNIDRLTASIDQAKKTGFGLSNNGLEDGIYGLAAPVFDESGQLAGAVAVASVANRITPTIEAQIKQHLMRASKEITHSWGGTIPTMIETCWAHSQRASR